MYIIYNYEVFMNKFKVILLLNIFIMINIFSTEHLFINSSPIRAAVVINGKDTKIVTPCILKDDQIKDSIISLTKSGYKEYRLSDKEIASGNVNITMIPISFDLYFPEKNIYKIGSTQMKGPVFVTGLNPGIYEIDLLTDRMTFTKSNSFLPYETAVGTALGISVAAMIVSIVISEYTANMAYNSPKDSSDYDFYTRATRNIDYLKFGAIGSSVALTIGLSSLIAVDVALKSSNKRSSLKIVNKTPSNQDDILYQTAMQFTGTGEIERSSQILKTIISMYPESDLLPIIHYQLGQNYYILGDLKNAREYWDTFVRDYPVYLYYDYVLKNLADIYTVEGDLENARYMLDRAVFTDDMLTKEAIYSQRAKIDYARYEKGKDAAVASLTEKEYSDLILNFPNSEKLDTYYLMLIKLYKLSGDADKNNKLKSDIEKNSSIDQSMKQLILSYF